jgi:hypothetical protein
MNRCLAVAAVTARFLNVACGVWGGCGGPLAACAPAAPYAPPIIAAEIAE